MQRMKNKISMRWSIVYWAPAVRQGFPGGSGVKNPPAKAGFDPWVGKIPWSKEMAAHCSVLAWEIPWTEEPGRLQSLGSQRVRRDLATKQLYAGQGDSHWVNDKRLS